MAMRVLPANMSSILTWKQVVGDENMSNVTPSVSYVYKWLGENVKDGICEILGRKVRFYEVHDEKMILSLK